MAISEAAKLDPRTAFDRPVVNRIGEGWGTSYAEPPLTTSLPLSVPGALPPAEPRQIDTPTPPPTETELREHLADAIAAKTMADEVLRRAEAAHDRAEHHRETCTRTLAGFAGLADEITAHVTEALRCDIGRVDPSIDEETELRIGDRAKAEVEMAAAERAASTLLGERATAAQRVGECDVAMKRAAAAVIAIAAEAMAMRIVAMEEEVAQMREALFGFNTVHNNSGNPLPPTVRRLFADGRRFLKPVDGAPWITARDALLVNPQAVVEVG
jgi:hypothetical protein